MTPIEINKKIAEIKGLIVLTSPENVPANQAKSIHEGGDCNTRKYHDAKIPNWAENISDAWELFEEMPNPFLFKDDGTYRCVIPELLISAYTAPLAICMAWLKWMSMK